MLRRQKKNFIETQNSIQEQIAQYEHDTQLKMKEVEKKKTKAEQLKKEIMEIKQKNEEDR